MHNQVKVSFNQAVDLPCLDCHEGVPVAVIEAPNGNESDGECGGDGSGDDRTYNEATVLQVATLLLALLEFSAPSVVAHFELRSLYSLNR